MVNPTPLLQTGGVCRLLNPPCEPGCWGRSVRRWAPVHGPLTTGKWMLTTSRKHLPLCSAVPAHESDSSAGISPVFCESSAAAAAAAAAGGAELTAALTGAVARLCAERCRPSREPCRISAPGLKVRGDILTSRCVLGGDGAGQPGHHFTGVSSAAPEGRPAGSVEVQ